MTKQDIAGKLAQGVRRAMQSSSAEPDAGTPVGGAPSPSTSFVSATASASRFARQTDQSPPASLDRPWDNLHPARIWPD